MKEPAKIYTYFQDSHYNGKIGFWSIDMTTNGKVEYIRRDVVSRAMWQLMSDWEHSVHADIIDVYINEAIDNADKD